MSAQLGDAALAFEVGGEKVGRSGQTPTLPPTGAIRSLRRDEGEEI